MHVKFLAPARAEFREAIAFYNDQKAGLGSAFAVPHVCWYDDW